MPISSAQSNIARIKKEIASLKTKFSQEARKEERKYKDFLNTKNSLGKTNLSSLQSKEKKISLLMTDIAKIQKTKAMYEDQIARKTKDLHRYEQQLAREQERKRKKMEGKQKSHIRKIANMQRSQQTQEIQHHRAVTQELEKQAELNLLLQSKSAKFWRIGSFWLFAFVLIAGIVLLIATSIVNWWILLLALFAIELFFVTSGAFLLRSAGDLSEKGFLELMELAFKFQVKGLHTLRKNGITLENEREIE